MPEINVSIMAVLIAVVANFVFGFIWYTPLFGKMWAKEMGFEENMKPSGSDMAKGMISMIIGNFLFAWVFAHNMAVWNPITWGLAPSEMSPVANGLMAAFFTWMGFYLPVDIGAVTWEGKSWKLFWINTGHHFFMLVIAAMIIAHI